MTAANRPSGESPQPCPFCNSQPSTKAIKGTELTLVECQNHACAIFAYRISLPQWNRRESRLSEGKRPDETEDLLEFAWGIIANAGGGNWTRETATWQDAAARWRAQYFATLPAPCQAGETAPAAPTPEAE